MEEDLVPNMEDEDEFEWAAGQEEDWMQEAFVSRQSPAERSGHIAVTDGSCMFIWGGYKVCIYSYLRSVTLTSN